MILFFDTETTGLPMWDEPSTSASQPHIVQLAMLLCDDDGTEREAHNVLVRPDGWVIPDDVVAIHGITQDRAVADGIPEEDATRLYVWAQAKSRMRVAHNESFDSRIMRIAMLRSGIERSFIEKIENRESYCTCAHATAPVNLPPTERMKARGMIRPKPPKLSECITHFFQEDLTDAHDALVDVRACARVYFHLKAMETIS